MNHNDKQKQSLKPELEALIGTLLRGHPKPPVISPDALTRYFGEMIKWTNLAGLKDIGPVARYVLEEGLPCIVEGTPFDITYTMVRHDSEGQNVLVPASVNAFEHNGFIARYDRMHSLSWWMETTPFIAHYPQENEEQSMFFWYARNLSRAKGEHLLDKYKPKIERKVWVAGKYDAAGNIFGVDLKLTSELHESLRPNYA